MNTVFSCVLLGEGTLPARCSEILQQRGHTVAAVISPDDTLRRHAAGRGIAPYHPPADLAELLGGLAFDLLFSIVNYQLIPAAVLRMPRLHAINYHDAPLPQYAGVHATSWAILHGEPQHGITWHLMADMVDAGDILQQELFAIEPDETALSLNLKCYDAAVRCFATLLAELETGSEIRRPQDLSRRSYFARTRRLPNAGIIDWHTPAEDIARMVRAVTFGSYANPLGTLRLATPAGFIAVLDTEIIEQHSTTTPGTIVAAGDTGLIVATTSRDLLLRRFAAPDGRELAPADLLRQGMHAGMRLLAPDQELAHRIEQLARQVARNEPYRVTQFSALQPLVLPFATPARGRPQPADFAAAAPATASLLQHTLGLPAPGDALHLAFLIQLARFSDFEPHDVGWCDDALIRQIAGLDTLFQALVPLRLALDPDVPTATAAATISAALGAEHRHGPYAADLAG
ncbi:MAG TPA: formyltransferase family protein, partial [Roseiflexaceae bacterium]|nr:formyltransferase family protein [Roseiflexaceae bacterium]